MNTKGYDGIDPAKLNWRKRSNGGGGNCVLVADLPDGGFAVQDSENPGVILWFNAGERESFVDGVKNHGLLD